MNGHGRSLCTKPVFPFSDSGFAPDELPLLMEGPLVLRQLERLSPPSFSFFLFSAGHFGGDVFLFGGGGVKNLPENNVRRKPSLSKATELFTSESFLFLGVPAPPVRSFVKSLNQSVRTGVSELHIRTSSFLVS